MSALLTYRSRNSFESRFGRNAPDPLRLHYINGSRPRPPSPAINEHWAVHNDGHKPLTSSDRAPTSSSMGTIHGPGRLDLQSTSPDSQPGSTPPTTPLGERTRATTYFSAQSYLRHQGEKFVKRFDSNCYIATTRKLDTHDVSRHRVDPRSPTPIADALAMIQQPALIIGIESDGLFTFAEQEELAAGIPNARLRTIDSPEGHDAFLLQFEQVNRHILEFLHDVLPDIMPEPGEAVTVDGDHQGDASSVAESSVEADAVSRMTTGKGSIVGEAEPETVMEDLVAW